MKVKKGSTHVAEHSYIKPKIADVAEKVTFQSVKVIHAESRSLDFMLLSIE